MHPLCASAYSVELEPHAMLMDRRSFMVGVGGLVASSFPAPAVAQARTKVTVSEGNHLSGYAPLYTAMRKGLFAKHLLDVELSTAGSISLPVPVLLAQRAQFALTAPATSVNATLEGGKMRNIAKMVGAVSLFAIAKPGLKINSVADFRGKTIATFRFPSSTQSIPTYLMRTVGGFDPKEAGVTFLELPPGAQAPAVRDGRADLAVVFDWDASIGVAQFGLEVVFPFAQTLGPVAFSTVFCTEQYVRANGEAVQRFCNALAEAMKLLHSDHNVFAEISALEFPQVPLEVIRLGSRNFMTTPHMVPRNPIIHKEEWDVIMTHEAGAGTLRQKLPYEEMVDATFAEKSAREFGLP